MRRSSAGALTPRPEGLPARHWLCRVQWFRAPGRVNLIGDYTDYNEGLVLPAAIQHECMVAADPAPRLALRTGVDVEPGWTRYVQAVGERLGVDRWIEGTVSSTLPPGAGLASSAALEVAAGLALAAVNGRELAPVELALVCRDAEEAATGVPCGVMDQLASICGRAGHALLIDCRTLEVSEVPLPAALALVVVHSGLPRRLETSAYAERRAECEAIARELGLRSLREATLEQVRERARARHVVKENARVAAAAQALRDGDLTRLRELFRQRVADVLAAAGARYAFLAEASPGAGERSPA